MAFHHVAYATRDVEATTRFYEQLMGFPLVHTEVQRHDDGWFRHLFYDTGDGQCIAFFELAGVGEKRGWSTDVSEAVGLPVWVNHAAFRATAEQQDEVRTRMTDAGVEPLMAVDHGWCQSLYFVDPNGIMVELCCDTPGFEPDPGEAKRLLAAPPEERG